MNVLESAQGRPLAPIIKRTPNPDSPGHELIQVACPYCAGVHHHGAVKGMADPGHRVAHCRNGDHQRGGYYVHDPKRGQA